METCILLQFFNLTSSISFPVRQLADRDTREVKGKQFFASFVFPKKNMATVKLPSMQDLLEAGVHFGHQVRRGNPKMKPYIFGAREGVHIIDLAKSEEKLKQAAEAAYELGRAGKVMLLIGTKKQSREIIEELAKEVDTPFLTSHWVGGLLTNFDEIKKNIKRLNDLREEQEKGSLSRYTKKEQLLISRKLQKHTTELGGVSKMDKIPDAMFIVDAVADLTAVKEARRMNVVLLGFSDTNSDPNLLDYPVPANDDGIKSIKLISETVLKSYGEGKKLGVKQEEVRVAKEQKEAEEKAVADKATADKEALDKAEAEKGVAEQAAAIEEEIENKIVDESSGKAA